MIGLSAIALVCACAPAAEPTDGVATTAWRVSDDDEGVPRPAPAPLAGSSAIPSASAGRTRHTHDPVGDPTPDAEAGALRAPARYVTGLAVRALGEVLRRHGVSCAQPDVQGDAMRWSCSGVDQVADVEYGAVIDGADEDRIRHVTALVTQFGQLDVERAAAFLGDVAAVDYRGARPERVRGWVRAWLTGAAQSDDILIGDAALALEGSLESASLDLVAPEAVGP